MTAKKSMTKSQLVSHLADQTGLTKKQSAQALDVIKETAYGEAKKGFTLPGIGKLVLQRRAARMGRNPATGESIQIPAKTVVKFRVSKACKDAVAPGKS